MKFPFRLLLILIVLHLGAELRAANYYINSISGSDSNTGNSKDAPWSSLLHLQGRVLRPGDSVLFAKGSSYTGGITLLGSGTARQPVVITAYSSVVDGSLPRKELGDFFRRYGAGPLPAFSNPRWDSLYGNIFRIRGNYFVIDGLYFHDNTRPPGSDKQNKNVQKMGVIYFALGSDHNVLRRCEFFRTPVAVKIKGSYNLIKHNYFHDATRALAQSWGPIAVMIVKPHNEVCYNRIENYGSYGGPYGSDGGVVELDGVDGDFDGRDERIHHNISVNNHGFLELAGRNVDSILVAYNLSDDTNQFIGGGSMKNVMVLHNTVIRTREPNVDRYIFWTFHPDATFMTVRNNIFVMAADITVFGPAGPSQKHARSRVGDQVHDHNLYYAAGNNNPIGISPGEGDIVAEPRFVDPANGNFRLRKDSPAIDAAAATLFKSDLDGYPVPRSGQPDMGAYEF